MRTVLRARRGGSALAKDEDGQATFEFLLVLPVFILLVLLVVDLGVLMYQYVSVSNAVREGARYASVNCGADAPCTADKVASRTAARSSGILAAANVAAGWPDGKKRGDPVVVRANRPYDMLFFPFAIPVYSCASMRLEAEDVGSGLPTNPAGC